MGHSPVIVPEAFFLPGTQFRSVHVLTTEQPDVSLVHEFFADLNPKVEVTVSRVAGFDDFRSEQDHFRFEEVLYRWILASKVPAQVRYICLSGGFKTMSAAMQKAAAVTGAADVFHVLSDTIWTDAGGRQRGPATLAEVLEAKERYHLHWIRLGPESGWPQLRSVRAEHYPLRKIREENQVHWIEAPDQAFRERLNDIVERSHRIAGAWAELDQLPFVELAAWPETALKWLRQPFDAASQRDCGWAAGLPKIELHCHLGGFATEGALLGQVRAAAQTPGQLPAVKRDYLPSRWPLPGRAIGLDAYRSLGRNNGSVLLRDPGCLQRQCELLYAHFVEQRVHYAEVRCSPANYAGPQIGRSPWDILSNIRRAFDRCMHTGGANPCHVNLIVIGTRHSDGEYRAGIARHLALAITASEHWLDPSSCRVVGVDLAGYEDLTTRAHYFREEFTGVHRCGLAVTIHAGENDDAEGVWRAVFDLNARRIGHALSLSQSPELRRSIADRGVGIEMCPYANYQVHGFPLDCVAKDEYPLVNYRRAGIRATINTDNIGISGATLTENLILAARLCPGLTRLSLLQAQRNAIDTAFLPADHRARLIQQFARAIPIP